jgi:hypothetical protein
MPRFHARSRGQTRAQFLFALAALPASAAFAGPDWQEIGDAGSLVDSGQPVVGSGNLSTLSGAFSDGFGFGDYEDVFLINIDNPLAFSVSIFSSVGTVGLFIFDVPSGNPIVGSISGTLTGTATDTTGAAITTPGLYALAIAVQGNTPGNDSGSLFSFASASEISGPDGNGGFGSLQGWSNSGQVGEYTVDTTGVTLDRIPAPGSVALLGLAAFASSRRRR